MTMIPVTENALNSKDAAGSAAIRMRIIAVLLLVLAAVLAFLPLREFAILAGIPALTALAFPILIVAAVALAGIAVLAQTRGVHS